MLALILAIFLLCIAGWIVGEVFGKPVLSIPCSLALMVMVGVSAHSIGSLGSSLQRSIEITGAVDRFVDATVQRLDQGDIEVVHDELRYVSEHINVSKEGGAYIDEMDEVSARLEKP